MLSPVMVIGTFTGDDIKRLDVVARLVVNCGTGQNATADEAMEINIREERMILLVMMILFCLGFVVVSIYGSFFPCIICF